MPTTRQFVLALMVAVLVGIVAAALRLSPGWLFGGMALVLAIAFVGTLRGEPRARRRGPAILLATTFLLVELVLVLRAAGSPFRKWMVAAVVLATFLAWALALFAKWRERSQLAKYAAIGLTLIMVPAVLLFVASDVPFI
jgi:CDP-diglyceride synthetase